MYDMKVTVAYIPCGKVIGLSKIARIADMAARRLQLQERIGTDIAEIIMNFEGEHAYRTVEHIPTMAKKAKIMVHEAIDSFIKKDLSTARLVKSMDDEIDALFEEVKQEVIEILKENSEKIDYCIDFLMIAKYLERVGDHAVNICEWLEFNQTGSVNDQRLI